MSSARHEGGDRGQGRVPPVLSPRATPRAANTAGAPGIRGNSQQAATPEPPPPVVLPPASGDKTTGDADALPPGSRGQGAAGWLLYKG
eukprot:13287186-Alexandrium_andersonii.AAC.1